jgi:hypothetical protein
MGATKSIGATLGATNGGHVNASESLTYKNNMHACIP